MKKYLSNNFKAIALIALVIATGAFSYFHQASAQTTVNNWVKTAVDSISTNTGNGLANADIHVRNCYIGAGTGTPCSIGGGGLSNVLTSANIFVGNASNIATGRAMTGDASISNTGVFTLGNTAVTPGSYTYANLTVDSKGRLTAASNGSLSKTAPLSGSGTLGDPIAMNGLSGLDQGDLIFGSAADTFSRLTKSASATRYLANTGVGNNPAWDFVNVGNGVTGVLSIANGGTNSSTASSAGSVVYSTVSAQAYSAVGTTGQALISGGTGAPTWFAPTAGQVIFPGISGILSSSSNLFWDNASGFLGIGTNVPTALEHLHNSTASTAVSTHYTNGTTGALVTDGSNVGINTTSDLVIQNLEAASVILNATGKTTTFDTNGNIRSNGVHNNATAAGTAAQQDIRSGTYTPTLANQVNLDGTATASQAKWLRVGNVVTVSGMFTADPTLAATITSFTLTFPIATNIGATADSTGTATCGNIASMSAAIQGNIAGDLATVRWISTDVTSQSWSYTYTYTVI